MTKKLIGLISTGGKTDSEIMESANLLWEQIQKTQNKNPKESQPTNPLSRRMDMTDSLMEQINQKAQQQGGLLPEPNDDIQVINFWENPKYPKKNIFQRIKRSFFSYIGWRP